MSSRLILLLPFLFTSVACQSLQIVALQALETQLIAQLTESRDGLEAHQYCALIDYQVAENLEIIEQARAEFDESDLWIEYLGMSALLFAVSDAHQKTPFAAVQRLSDLYDKRDALKCPDTVKK